MKGIGNCRNDATINRGFLDKLPRWMAEYRVPAVGIALIEEGTVKEARVFGELRKGVRAPDAAIFNVASLTKPVFALLVLRFVDAGKWGLDEPLFPYWVDPDIKDDPRHRILTPRLILSHQTGFPNWRHDRKLAFEFEPGTKYQYSGEGFEYLRQALERKFKKPLEELAGPALLRPLGMKDTHFFWDKTMEEARFAVPHDAEGKPLKYDKRTRALASDELLTTAKDYGNFGATVINGGGVSRRLFNEMVRPHIVASEAAGSYFGLGWELFQKVGDGESVLIHSGSDPGTQTIVLLLPKTRRGLVVLTNGDKGQEVYIKVIRESLNVGQELYERATRKK